MNRRISILALVKVRCRVAGTVVFSVDSNPPLFSKRGIPLPKATSTFSFSFNIFYFPLKGNVSSISCPYSSVPCSSPQRVVPLLAALVSPQRHGFVLAFSFHFFLDSFEKGYKFTILPEIVVVSSPHSHRVS